MNRGCHIKICYHNKQNSPCSSMYSTMCFTSAGTSWPLIVCVRVTSSNGTPKTRMVLAELPPSLLGNGDALFLMAFSSSSPQPRQDLTSSRKEEELDKKRGTGWFTKQEHNVILKSDLEKRSSVVVHKQTRMNTNIQEWLLHTMVRVLNLPQSRRGGLGGGEWTAEQSLRSNETCTLSFREVEEEEWVNDKEEVEEFMVKCVRCQLSYYMSKNTNDLFVLWCISFRVWRSILKVKNGEKESSFVTSR